MWATRGGTFPRTSNHQCRLWRARRGGGRRSTHLWPHPVTNIMAYGTNSNYNGLQVRRHARFPEMG